MSARQADIGHRVDQFCERFGLGAPIIQSPMSGASPVDLAVAVAGAGGLGGFGAYLAAPEEIAAWSMHFREVSAGPFQINLWVPETGTQASVADHQMREFLKSWYDVKPEHSASPLPDFEAQWRATLAVKPVVVSTIMGLPPTELILSLKKEKISWFACATSIDEALAAEALGADAIVAQGFEAGGHRGTFLQDKAQGNLVGLMSLIPRLADALTIPVIAAGGISDGRTCAAALVLGASAVQIGTALLRAPEAGIPKVWADSLEHTRPEETKLTRIFTGRLARACGNDLVDAAAAPGSPEPLPYPVQRELTSAMRAAAAEVGDRRCMALWSGQSSRPPQAQPAADIVTDIWREAIAYLPERPVLAKQR